MSLIPGDPSLSAIVELADSVGIRLEIMDGLRLWHAPVEAMHSVALGRVRDGLVVPAGWLALTGVHIAFPGGGLKCPDLAVWCREPDEEDEAVTLIPEAVIEIVSRGSERKDLELNPEFYLRHGVKEYLVFDPFTNVVLYHTPNSGPRRLDAPVGIALARGCRVEF